MSRTGQRESDPAIPDELLVEIVPDSEQLRVRARAADSLGHGRADVFPAWTVLGAITFVAADVAGAFDDAALAFARGIRGARATSAVENARLYRERHGPPRRCSAACCRRGCRRSPAGQRRHALPAGRAARGVIGGDFFDLFLVDDGFTVVIGDVAGKGIEAAALTALARHSLRASALLEPRRPRAWAC